MQNLLSDTSAGAYVLALVGVFVFIFLFIFMFVWLIDMVKKPNDVWEAAGQNRTLWLILWVVTFVLSVNVILGAVYWFVIRPKLSSATA